MSTIFLGTTEFAAAILECLAQSESHRPTLVITRPDRPSGRGRRLTSPPVAERARALEIPLEQPESVNAPDARAAIARAGRPPDGDREDDLRQTVIVCAFGALIKEPLLSEQEILNVHPSLLPRWRGAAPVERAIMAGDTRTGVSIMRLTAGLDSGPVCLSVGEPIGPEDTYDSLALRLQRLGGDLLVRALEERPPFIEQAEDGVTYAEKIGPGDRLLDPSRPAAQLERVVRALHPHVGARVELRDGTMLGVQRAALADVGTDAGTGFEAGHGSRAGAESAASPASSARADSSGLGVTEQDGRLLLRCRDGALELLVIQPPGGRPMDASSYLRGHGAAGRL